MGFRSNRTGLRADRALSAEAQGGGAAAEMGCRLGEAVRTMREARNLTRAELAVSAGTTSSAIARLEGGGTVLTLALLERVAAALDAEVDVRIVVRGGTGLGAVADGC